MALFRSDRRTDGQTKMNHLSAIREIFCIFYEGKGGKLFKPYNIFAPSLCDARFAGFNREG